MKILRQKPLFKTNSTEDSRKLTFVIIVCQGLKKLRK